MSPTFHVTTSNVVPCLSAIYTGGGAGGGGDQKFSRFKLKATSSLAFDKMLLKAEGILFTFALEGSTNPVTT